MSGLHDEPDERRYWWSRTPAERLAAIETMRRVIYGHAAITRRLPGPDRPRELALILVRRCPDHRLEEDARPAGVPGTVRSSRAHRCFFERPSTPVATHSYASVSFRGMVVARRTLTHARVAAEARLKTASICSVLALACLMNAAPGTATPVGPTVEVMIDGQPVQLPAITFEGKLWASRVPRHSRGRAIDVSGRIRRHRPIYRLRDDHRQPHRQPAEHHTSRSPLPKLVAPTIT